MMRKVSDPNLLSQLNGVQSSAPIGLKKISDPSVLAQLNGGKQDLASIYLQDINNPLPIQQPSFRERADDFIQALVPNLLLPEAKGGNMALNALDNILASTALNTALAQSNPRNVNNISQNVKENALISAGSQALPYGLGAIAKGAKGLNLPWNPVAKAQDIIKYLGNGAQNAEENAQQFSKDLYKNHAEHINKASSYFDKALKKYGDEEIYPTIYKTKEEGIFRYPDQKTAIKSIPDINLDNTSNYAKDLYSKFKESPTLDKAHKLQSEIYTEIAQANKMPPSFEKRAVLDQLNTARNEIKGGIEKFLDEKDPEALKAYKQGADYFRKNVVPYRSDAAIRKIVEGKETNPANLHGSFDYPTDLMDKATKEANIGPIKKIVSDMKPQTKNRILFSKIGAHKPNITPESLSKSAENARQSGYSNYFTPELNQMLETMSARSRRSQARSKTAAGTAQIAGMLGGAGLGHYLNTGTPGVAEIGGALAGSPIANVIINSLRSLNLSPSLQKKIANTIASTYQPVTRSIGENYLLEGQNK